MMREIEQFYSTQIEEMPMYVTILLFPFHFKQILTKTLQERGRPYLNQRIALTI